MNFVGAERESARTDGRRKKILQFGLDLKVKWELMKDPEKDVIFQYEVGRGGNIKQVSFLYSYDFYQFLRTLTRILGSRLHAACVSSLVFIIWRWPCQMSVYLILWSNFLLENKHK